MRAAKKVWTVDHGWFDRCRFVMVANGISVAVALVRRCIIVGTVLFLNAKTESSSNPRNDLLIVRTDS